MSYRLLVSGQNSRSMELTRQFVRAFYERNCLSVAGFLSNHGVREADLEDLVQECFLIFWTNRTKVRKGEERAYLFGIARNLVKDYHERNSYFNRLVDQVRETRSIDVSAEAVAADLLQKENRDLIRSLLDRLPRQMAEVMRLLYLEDLPRETVADRLGISVKTVYSQESRAKSRLNGTGSDIWESFNAMPDPKKNNEPQKG